MAGERFRATINGGIKIGRPSNLAQTMQFARPHIDKGHAVYVRAMSAEHIIVTFRRVDPASRIGVTAHNAVGTEQSPPDWATKALNIINT